MTREMPGAVLLSPAAVASAIVVLVNDLWLKRVHPGVLSGKLSDLALCVFFPLFLFAVFEWAGAVSRRLRIERADVVACFVAGAYFAAIKAWPAATHAHVAWLSALVPGWRFRAVSDPTDLLCLPAMALAWWTLGARRSPGATAILTSS